MGKILGVVILVGITYMIFSWKNSISDIRAVCDFSTEGMPTVVVVDKITSLESLKFSNFENDKKQVIIVHSAASFGRHTCTIEHRDNKVVASEYLFMD